MVGGRCLRCIDPRLQMNGNGPARVHALVCGVLPLYPGSIAERRCRYDGYSDRASILQKRARHVVRQGKMTWHRTCHSVEGGRGSCVSQISLRTLRGFPFVFARCERHIPRTPSDVGRISCRNQITHGVRGVSPRQSWQSSAVPMRVSEASGEAQTLARVTRWPEMPAVLQRQRH